MLKRILLWSFIVLCFFISCFSVYKYIANGSIAEREDLLQATVWEISSSGHVQSDVESIHVRYNFFLGGLFPYETYVKFKGKPEVVIYSWESEKKNKVEKVGVTSD